MAEFLFIVPEGWTQLDWQTITNSLPNMGGPYVTRLLQSGGLMDIEATLKEGGIIPAEASLIDAKLFNDEVFIVKLG